MDWLAFYEKVWALREKDIAELAETESDLSRLLAAFDRREAANPVVFGDDGAVIRAPSSKRSDPLDNLEGRSGYTAGVLGRPCAYDSFNFPQLLSDLAQGCSHVVEIGSGMGRQLFSIWLAGGPPDAAYIGLEPVAAANNTARILAAKADGMRFSAFDFRLETPDFSGIVGADKALVFSHWALNQAPALASDFFHKIWAVAQDVILVMFEPVGWQIDGSDEIDSAQKHNTVNNNMCAPIIPRFRQAVADGLFEPLMIKKHFYGPADVPGNLGSLVIAEKIP